MNSRSQLRFLVSIIGTAGALLTGCVSPGYVALAIGDSVTPHRFRAAEVYIDHMPTPPQITVVDDNTISISHLNSLAVSDFWAVPKAQVKDGKVLISGYYTSREKYGPFEVKLNPGDQSLKDLQFYWVDPDGKETELVVGKGTAKFK